MRWDFSVEPGPVGSGVHSPVELYGTRIYKTLYDDNNIELTKIETTAEDAFINGEPGFSEEYRLAALAIFSAKLDELFVSREVYPPSLSSLAILFGNHLRDTLNDLIIIKTGSDN